jgi:quercetin dioxygenase-like cupin family protein
MSHYFPTEEEKGRHVIFPGVNIETAAGNQMSLSLAILAPRAVVEEHCHPHEQVGMVVEGKAIFIVGGETKTLGPGDFYRIPGSVPHKVIALENTVKALDVFCPVREEYR